MQLRTARLVVALVLIALLAACAGGGADEADPTTPSNPAANAEPLKVLTTDLLSHAPLFLADELGLFEEAGLNIEVVPGQNAPELIPLLESGDLDVWSGSPTPALYALIDAGVPIRIVADKGHVNEDCAYWSFVARREMTESEGWGTAEGMRKLRVGRPAAASTPNFYTDAALDKIGLSQDDMRMVDLPFPAAAESVARGQTDLGMVVEPSLTAALRDPKLAMWSPSHETVPGMQAAVIVFGPRLVEREPELGNQFMRAYLDAVETYNAGPTPENLEILAEQTGVEAEVLKDACWPAIAADGSVNLDSLIDSQEWAVGEGLQDGVVPPDAFWDSSFITAAAGSP